MKKIIVLLLISVLSVFAQQDDKKKFWSWGGLDYWNFEAVTGTNILTATDAFI